MNRKIDKSPLAVTAWDLILAKQRPDPRLTAEPHKTYGQVMTEEELLAYLFKSITRAITLHKKAQSGNADFKHLFKRQLDEFLIPDMLHLREIGRMPKEFEHFDPAAKFSL